MNSQQMQEFFAGVNPLASQIENGVNYPVCDSFVDIPFIYVYAVSLTANQTLVNQGQDIDKDSAFEWRATVITTGATVNVRFSDGNGQYLSNGFLPGILYDTGLSTPTPQFPSLILEPGGRIVIDLQNPNNSSVDFVINFIGVKRYKR